MGGSVIFYTYGSTLELNDQQMNVDHDIHTFNEIIQNFIRFSLSKLDYNSPEEYAKALYGFYNDAHRYREKPRDTLQGFRDISSKCWKFVQFQSNRCTVGVLGDLFEFLILARQYSKNVYRKRGLTHDLSQTHSNYVCFNCFTLPSSHELPQQFCPAPL